MTMEPRERYLRDPMFKALVDAARVYIREARFTPTELREAVILAATIEEERRPVPAVPLEALDRKGGQG